ncbi:coiled-coil domain-containing protein-domain-containing protein [Xylaria bambusicola]|uniref:coiled-coil domain-containing protein-domain-containing protein n=1 Tax=Xylaria bambusicola TaxID=326684 RepID=UPI002008D2E7|nr:coiled-coil domain-containing protein-domain-containing protein [Xylaria bambusicola]KAI0522126.1 coiled-coil domain-containing protein-domain-containing protein [Xylaria bambusicola]
MAPLISSPESSASNSYERPQPRPPKTPAHAAQIRVRNRRREWLSRHPSYFRSLEHELADPPLYDVLIRRFQSHEEREKEGRAKGFGRVLEVDILRGEARLSRLADQTRSRTNDTIGESFNSDSLVSGADSTSNHLTQLSYPQASCRPPETEAVTDMNWEELDILEAHDLEKRSAPKTAEEGRMRWDEFLRLRFIAGGDEDFDYRSVDEDDEFDALERREQEDAWFDIEEPGWVGESDYDDEVESKGEGKKSIERPLTGETGVQDF